MTQSVPAAAGVHQVTLEFRAEEDRLLMRVALGEGEFLLWLTRRCVRLLWAALLKLMQAAPRIALQADEEARRTLVGLDHARIVAASDFSTPYRGAPATADAPAAAAATRTAVLVSRIEVRAAPARQGQAGHVEIALKSSSGNGLLLEMSPDLPHALAALLKTATAAAQWELDLALPGALPDGADRAATASVTLASRPLH